MRRNIICFRKRYFLTLFLNPTKKSLLLGPLIEVKIL